MCIRVVGQVAETGKHLWLSSDDVSNGKIDPELVLNVSS